MANAIVLEVLDFVRPIRLQVERIALADVVRDAISHGGKPCAARRRRAGASTLPEDLPPIQGDPHQLRQLFTNLLTNAFEAMGGKGQVRIAAHAARGRRRADGGGESCTPVPMIQVEVADNGPGVPADVMDRIFSPFFTTKPQGSGLGWPSCGRSSMRTTGGSTSASPLEGGTRFRVTLPVSGSHELFR